MKITKKILALLFMLSTILFWMGCEKDPVDNPNSGGSSYSLVKISGDNQTDTVNVQLSQALKVQVKDSLGVGLEGISVSFSISSGGGSLSATSVMTNVSGFAEVFWTLGTVTGIQMVSASSNVVVGSPQSFSATVIAASTGGNSPCSPTFGTMTDSRDGEVYQTVTICNQTWMAENLRYDVLNVVTLDTINPAHPSTTYGRLYDWATVMNGSGTSSSSPSGVQGICPSGWHLPSDAEWSILEVALGMNSSDSTTTGYRGPHGTGMKSTTGWNSGVTTNTSGFNALPAGLYFSGNFSYVGASVGFWSSTEYSSTYAWYRNLNYGYTGVRRTYDGKTSGGYSCRCVKD